jgi:hypothetical protein
MALGKNDYLLPEAMTSYFRLPVHPIERPPRGVGMSPHHASLIEELESRIRQKTHNRIRDLSIHETQGRVVVRGRVPTYHSKQLALLGILEILPGDRLHADIAVS